MYEFAYNEVIEDSRQAMRARERQAMDRVIAMLRAAQETGPQSRERVDALYYLHRLWMIFLNDLNDLKLSATFLITAIEQENNFV